MPALTSAISAACRPAPPLRPVPQMPGAHEARHDDPNLCVLLLALPRALSQPELCPQLRAWLPFRCGDTQGRERGAELKLAVLRPFTLWLGRARRGTPKKIPFGLHKSPNVALLTYGRHPPREGSLSA